MQVKKTSTAVPTLILPRIFSGSIWIPVPKKKSRIKKNYLNTITYDRTIDMIKGKIR